MAITPNWHAPQYAGKAPKTATYCQISAPNFAELNHFEMVPFLYEKSLTKAQSVLK